MEYTKEQIEALFEAQHNYCAMAEYMYKCFETDDNRYSREYDIRAAIDDTEIAYQLGLLIDGMVGKYEHN